MKRMLAVGAPSIYSIGPVFRADERGPHHNVEFTMLEWYDVGSTIDQEIKLLGELAMTMLDRSGYETQTYRQLFQQRLGFDPIDISLPELCEQLRQLLNDAPLADRLATDRDALLEILMSQSIQPHLGHASPLIVKDYPLSQAALARQAADPQCAARFELFVDGIELANGYDELLDAEIFQQRRITNNAQR